MQATAGIKQIEAILNGADMPKTRIRFAIGEARTAAEIALVPASVTVALIDCYGRHRSPQASGTL